MSIEVCAHDGQVRVSCPDCGESETYRTIDIVHLRALERQHDHHTYSADVVDELIRELSMAHHRMDKLGYRQARTAA